MSGRPKREDPCADYEAICAAREREREARDPKTRAKKQRSRERGITSDTVRGGKPKDPCKGCKYHWSPPNGSKVGYCVQIDHYPHYSRHGKNRKESAAAQDGNCASKIKAT